MSLEGAASQLTILAQVVEANTDGISDEESLYQPGAAGNCMNWILGHLVKSRNEALRLTGQNPLLPMEQFAPYGQGSERLTDGAGAIPFAELLESFRALQEPLVSGMRALPAEALGAPVPKSPTGNPNETVGSLLHFVAFHEAYHAGQLGLLRALLGKKRLVP